LIRSKRGAWNGNVLGCAKGLAAGSAAAAMEATRHADVVESASHVIIFIREEILWTGFGTRR
jgi:hypothetical protein